MQPGPGKLAVNTSVYNFSKPIIIISFVRFRRILCGDFRGNVRFVNPKFCEPVCACECGYV